MRSTNFNYQAAISMAEEKKKFGSVFTDGDTDEAKKKRFEAGGIISMGSLLAGGIFQILWMATITRMLGDRDMGLFGPMIFGFFLAATILALGVPQTITTFVALHYEKDFDESVKFITDGMRLMLLLTAGGLIVGVCAAALLWATGVMSPVQAAMIAAFVASIAAIAYFWGFQGVLNGFQRLDLVAIGNFVFPIGIFAASLYLITIAQKTAGAESRWDVVGAVAALGFGNLVGLVAAFLTLRATRTVSMRGLFAFRSKHGLYGRILAFGGWSAATLLAMTVVQNMPPIITRTIGMRWLLFGDTPKHCESAIGLFSTASLYGGAAMLLVGIAISIVPAISEAEGQGRHDLMQCYYDKALSQSFVILTAFVVIFVVLIGPIIELISGPQFPAKLMGPLGTLSIIGGAGAGMLFVMINLFIGLKLPKLPAITLFGVIILLIAVSVGLSFLMHNVRGPQIAFIAATWGGSILLFAAAAKKFQLKFPWGTLLKPIAACAAPLLFVLFVMPEPNKLWIMGVDLLLLLGPFAFFMFLLERFVAKKAPEPAG